MPAISKVSLAILSVLGAYVEVSWAGTCPDDPESDICDNPKPAPSPEGPEEETNAAVKFHSSGASSLILTLLVTLGAHDVKNPALMLVLPVVSMLPRAMAASEKPKTTCAHVQAVYRKGDCCGKDKAKTIPHQIVPNPPKRLSGNNPCAGKKSLTTTMKNKECFKNGVREAGEQSGADVTQGYEGLINSSLIPISIPYFKTALCPVNVHWHLGAEHRSEGQYDENGKSPENHLVPSDDNPEDTRRLGQARYGYACHLYDKTNVKHNTEYDWKYCKNMHVGETYEVHWPHSSLGACGTPNQYQDPFYDGVFCGATAQILGSLSAQDIANNVGVQGQVFTIVNDDTYYYPDLVRGMVVDADNNMGIDVAAYTGSTTGTTRNNKICSAYTPITWQVDRKCHLISASAFDKMCADMLQMRDDMSGDIHPHGARELVWSNLTANNQMDLQV